MSTQTNSILSLPLTPRIRKSPFFDATQRYGAKAYSVYNHMYMPLYYVDPVTDYWSLVNDVTLWDVGSERQVEITGPDAFTLVRMLTPRNLSKFRVGQCRYVMIVDEDGGILNDPVLLRVEENRFWLSLADSDTLLWVKGVAFNSGLDVTVTEPDVSPLQLQGPKAADVAADVFGDWVLELKYFRVKLFEHEGMPLAISRTGWSGASGYEIYLCDGRYGDQLWDTLMEAGKPYDIAPAAPSAINRLEAGMFSLRTDFWLECNPYELGLDRLVDLEQDFEYIGKAALKKIKAEGISRLARGMHIEYEEEIAGNGDHWPIVTADGEPAGVMTTCVYSPRLETNIALSFMDMAYSEIGTEVVVQSPYGDLKATVQGFPLLDTREEMRKDLRQGSQAEQAIQTQPTFSKGDTMKAVIFHEHGDPSVLRYEDVPMPEVRPDDVLIKVLAIGVNRNDLWARESVPGVKHKLPHMSGSDVAGTVVQVGSNVTSHKVGDEVYIHTSISCRNCDKCNSGQEFFCREFHIFGFQTGPLDGGYAEYVRIPAANALHIPEGVSHMDAACLSMSLLTVWHMLVVRAQLKEGESLLLLGVGSSIGTIALQLAKNVLGATVIATAGTAEKLDKAIAWGADYAINHYKFDIAKEVRSITNKRGVDVVFEHVGEATWEKSIRSLAWGGRLVICGNTTGFEPKTDLRFLFNKQLSLLGSHQGSREDLIQAMEYAATGEIKAVIETVLPLSQAAKAHEMMYSGDHYGKIMLVPDSVLNGTDKPVFGGNGASASRTTRRSNDDGFFKTTGNRLLDNPV
ncbi:MAG: zinc-binding dehydrogenase [Chloroflexota bacterium]